MEKFFKLETDASISPMTTWMKNEHQNIRIDNVRSVEEKDPGYAVLSPTKKKRFVSYFISSLILGIS